MFLLGNKSLARNPSISGEITFNYLFYSRNSNRYIKDIHKRKTLIILKSFSCFEINYYLNFVDFCCIGEFTP